VRKFHPRRLCPRRQVLGHIHTSSSTAKPRTANDRSQVVMSGRALSVRWAPLARRGITPRRNLHRSATARASRLLRVDGAPSLGRRNQWPFGASSIHNVPAVRSVSFARVLPQLALKMVRLPALLGASMVAGLAYLQYQAARKPNRL
jgi:dynamin-like GTPase MGM1, mitochondrial